MSACSNIRAESIAAVYSLKEESLMEIVLPVYFERNNDYFFFLLKKSHKREWEGHSIIAIHGERKNCDVTSNFDEDIFSQILKTILMDTGVKIAMEEIESIEDEKYQMLRNQASDPIFQQGHRIYKKINKYIKAIFSVENDHMVFKIPLDTQRDIENEVVVSSIELAEKYESEDEFVTNAVLKLKSAQNQFYAQIGNQIWLEINETIPNISFSFDNESFSFLLPSEYRNKQFNSISVPINDVFREFGSIPEFVEYAISSLQTLIEDEEENPYETSQSNFLH